MAGIFWVTVAVTCPRILQMSCRRDSSTKLTTSGSKGSGFKVKGLGFRVKGSGFRVKGSGFRVKG
jgi:hypothetical protein